MAETSDEAVPAAQGGIVDGEETVSSETGTLIACSYKKGEASADVLQRLSTQQDLLRVALRPCLVSRLLVSILFATR